MATPALVLEKPEPAYTSYAAFVTLHTPCLHIHIGAVASIVVFFH